MVLTGPFTIELDRKGKSNVSITGLMLCSILRAVYGQSGFISVTPRSCERVTPLAAVCWFWPGSHRKRAGAQLNRTWWPCLSGHANCRAVAEQSYFQVLWFSFYPIRILQPRVQFLSSSLPDDVSVSCFCNGFLSVCVLCFAHFFYFYFF